MALRIATNVQALAAQRNLGWNHEAQNKSLERLASGARINRSGDDAAGLAISEKIRGQVRSMKQAARNANDGISLVQVAEGGLTEISNILVRIRELSIQAASDTIGDVERGFLDKEVQGLLEEIDRISLSTEFNGKKILDGSTPQLEIQVGIKNDPMQDRLIFDGTKLAMGADVLGVAGTAVATKEQAQDIIERIDPAISRLNEARSDLGALQNRMQSTLNNLHIYGENLEAARSRIRDTDVAEESTELVKYNILTQSNIAMLAQANNNNMLALKLIG